jgi:hypothetical protein
MPVATLALAITIADVLSVLVLAFVGVRLVEAARITIDRRHRTLRLVRGLRLRHFALAVPVWLGVVTVYVVLAEIPGLDIGWWSVIGGDGNPAFGSTSAGGGALDWLPFVFIPVLAFALPVLVESEERTFRLGAETRTTAGNLRRALWFGLVHAVVGIPLAAALALTVGGCYLTQRYLRVWRVTQSRDAALAESTRAHLAYNLTILAMAVPLLVYLELSG